MFKKSYFRKPFESQHGKTCGTCLKSAWQHFYHIFSSTCAKLRCKMSLLVICKILGLFVSTLTDNDKYSFHNSENLPQPIQLQLPKKLNYFSEFFDAFVKFGFTFENFGKKITFIDYLLPKLLIAKANVK